MVKGPSSRVSQNNLFFFPWRIRSLDRSFRTDWSWQVGARSFQFQIFPKWIDPLNGFNRGMKKHKLLRNGERFIVTRLPEELVFIVSPPW